jgi:SAM-dependent methyltransferase
VARIEPSDAFGRALLDWVGGAVDPEVHEREDGYVEAGAGPEHYLAAYDRWPDCERRAMGYVRGRTLDLGCGAGRVALHLQGDGIDVVGVDSSPLAVRAARAMGVRHLKLAAAQSLTPEVHSFDTVLLLGNNAGIFGSPRRLRSVLASWARQMGSDGRVLAGSTSPYGGEAPVLDAGYRRANRNSGRMAGELRMRIRYRQLATPWFWWLFVSEREMRALVDGTGWRCTDVLAGTPPEPFVAVLEKDADGAGRTRRRVRSRAVRNELVGGPAWPS